MLTQIFFETMNVSVSQRAIRNSKFECITRFREQERV